MNVDWRWHGRYRGLLPLSPHALADDGRLVFVRPDELEARKYLVLELTGARGEGSGESGVPEGSPDRVAVRPTLVASLTVETVRQMLVSAGSSLWIGVTDDDLYLFREGRKSRFLPDRQVSYLSVALARDGDQFASAFTDMLFAGQTLCLANASGKVIWTRDLDAPIARAAIAPDGRSVVVGLEDGTLAAYDAGRSLLWEAVLEEAPAALALTEGAGGRCVAATTSGLVLAIDGGEVAWRAELDLSAPLESGRVPPQEPLLLRGGCSTESGPLALACDARGTRVAVAGGHDTEGWVLLLDAEGHPAWEHGTDTPITGVALSPAGLLLALSQADGGLLLFDVEAGRLGLRAGRPAADEELRRALAARDAGRTAEARQALLRVLEADPGNLEACEALITLDEAARVEALVQADQRVADRRFSEALDALETARAAAPADEELPRRWSSVLDAAENDAACEAARSEAGGDYEGAVLRWRDLLLLDPKRRRAREEIRRLSRLAAVQLTREGEAALAAGKEEEALAVWRRAHAVAPSEVLAERLRAVEVQRYVRFGIELYGQQRFAEAAFQLRKALALQPDHADALRYLAYISGTGPQSPLSERFSRLE